MGNFFGSGKQTSQQTQTQTQQASPEAMAAYKGLLERVQQVGATPYQAYQGQLVAGFTPMQEQAFQGAESAQGIYQPALTEAMTMTGRAAAPISGAQIQQYMNPYQESVINATMANIDRQNQIQQEQLKSGAVSRGAFGGDRAGIAAAELARSQNLASQQTLAGLEAGGFQQAMAAAQAEQNRALQAGGQYAGLAGTTQALAGRDISTLAQLGQQQQALEQARLGSAYGQYQLGQAFPYQQLSWMAPLITGTGGAMGGTTTGTSYGTMTPAAPSMASQVAGLGMAAASLPPGVTSGIGSTLSSIGSGIGSALSSLGPLALLASTGGAVTEKSHGGSVTEKADGGSMFGLGSMAQMPHGGTQGFIPAAAQMPQGGMRAPTLNFQQPQLIKGTTGEDIFKQASGLADAWKKRSERVQKAEDRKQDEAQDAADDMAESWNAGTEVIPEAKRGGFIHGFANGGAPEDIDWSPIEPDRNRMAGFSTPASNAIEAFRENAQAEQARGFETEAGTKAFTERAPAEQGPAKSTRQLTFGDSTQTFPKPPSEPLQQRPLGSDIPGEWQTQSFADLKGRAEEGETPPGRAGFPEPMYAGARGLLPSSPPAPRGSAAEVIAPLSSEQVKAKEERRNWLGLDEETRRFLWNLGTGMMRGSSPYTLQNLGQGLQYATEQQNLAEQAAQQRAAESSKLWRSELLEREKMASREKTAEMRAKGSVKREQIGKLSDGTPVFINPQTLAYEFRDERTGEIKTASAKDVIMESDKQKFPLDPNTFTEDGKPVFVNADRTEFKDASGNRLDPNKLQSMDPATVAGIRAARVEEEKLKAKAKNELPTIEKNTESALKKIDAVIQDPYLPNMIGTIYSKLPDISKEAKNTQGRIDQLQGLAMASAYRSVRGAGSISNDEGKRLEKSFSRLVNMSVSDNDYLQALHEFRRDLFEISDAVRVRAGLPSKQYVPPAPVSLMEDVRKNQGRGKLAYDKDSEMYVYTLPDGSVRSYNAITGKAIQEAPVQ